MDAMSPALLVKAALTAAVHTAQAPRREVWHQLAELVARSSDTKESSSLCASGRRELDALTAAPTSEARAQALADVLTRRAGDDPQFREALQAWENEVRSRSLQDEPPLQAVASCVQGSVMQSGFLSGISFVTYGPQDRKTST
ncbi:hypothetical protein ACWHA6_37010 [Streptomyces anthocyanicus]|uniref:hypothetical protein n=1 Tax=Streptomyces TaxID=1883 RepID=UPI00364F0C33